LALLDDPLRRDVLRLLAGAPLAFGGAGQVLAAAPRLEPLEIVTGRGVARFQV
jgi:hypothetical protein